MNNRVLAAYATKHGSTAEIAERIGQTLREAEIAVDVKAVDTVDDLTAYQAVVLGSAGRASGLALFQRADRRGRPGRVDGRLAFPRQVTACR